MKRILIVDDMAICREPMADALRQHGYDAHCAQDGTEALSILRDRPTDLVLLDVNMPGIDGISVLRTMKRHPALNRIPVILLTDRAERSVVVSAVRGGAHSYLLKSQFSLPQLLARIESALGLEPVAAAADAGARGGARSRYGHWRTAVEQPPTPHQGASADAPTRSGAGVAVQGSVAPAINTANRGFRAINELQPVIKRSDLVALVNEGLALRPLGQSVHNVMKVTANSDCCAEDVAKAIIHDQALCIRVLKLANSSAYARGHHVVDGVKDAVQRIGVQEVRSLVMVLGVFEEFEGVSAEHVNPQLFWEHSIGCGLAASNIATALRAPNIDDYFLWGMLHDVGRLILLEHAPDSYGGVWEVAEGLGVPLEAVEAKLMLLDHCDILEQALEHWQFPREFIAPVVNHHHVISRIKRLGPTNVQPAATVALANRIIHALLIGSSGNDVIYPLDDLVDHLDLPEEKIIELVAQIPEETNKLKIAMLARSNDRSWPEYASSIRTQLGPTFKGLCVSSRPGTDAIRLFCARLAPAPDDEPSVGVVYVRDAGEIQNLMAELEAQERQFQIAELPVVVVRARGKMTVDCPKLRARRHAFLDLPLRIPDFVKTVAVLRSGDQSLESSKPPTPPADVPPRPPPRPGS